MAGCAAGHGRSRPWTCFEGREYALICEQRTDWPGSSGMGVKLQAFAPKGHDIPAQGNALGLRRIPHPQALKGRDISLPDSLQPIRIGWSVRGVIRDPQSCAMHEVPFACCQGASPAAGGKFQHLRKFF
jgi:hypothetical protein